MTDQVECWVLGYVQFSPNIASYSAQAGGKAIVSPDTVMPFGATPSAIALMIFGERYAKTARRLTYRSPRFSAAATSSKEAILPSRMERIQRCDRLIALSRTSRVSASMNSCPLGELVTPLRLGPFGMKGWSGE